MVEALQRTYEGKTRVIERLWQLTPERRWHAPHLYFLIDAARDRRIYPKLVSWQKSVEIVSLYEGALASDLAEVAPYLFCLGSDLKLFNWLWEQGWGQSWGIFAWCRGENLASLRRHFRRLTVASVEGSGSVMFRFYDPSILSDFVPVCTKDQLSSLFGPVQRYIMEAEQGRTLREFRRSDGGTLIETTE